MPPLTAVDEPERLSIPLWLVGGALALEDGAVEQRTEAREHVPRDGIPHHGIVLECFLADFAVDGQPSRRDGLGANLHIGRRSGAAFGQPAAGGEGRADRDRHRGLVDVDDAHTGLERDARVGEEVGELRPELGGREGGRAGARQDRPLLGIAAEEALVEWRVRRQGAARWLVHVSAFQELRRALRGRFASRRIA